MNHLGESSQQSLGRQESNFQLNPKMELNHDMDEEEQEFYEELYQ